jgi:6,7-dimethyl-8-ribityllumazine synthase
MGEKGESGSLDASDLRIAVVVARYNQPIGDRLLEGALDALRRHGGEQPEIYWVPGALEIPLTAQALAESGRIDAVICLGCVIRGETAHFEYVAAECAAGVTQVALETGTPCSFGVLTTNDEQQALARSEPDNNKGSEAAETAIEMANLLRLLRSEPVV